MDIAPLYLKPGEEKRLKGGHLWVFSNEVDAHRCDLGAFTPGEPVQIRDADGKALGNGYINPHSLICARLLTRNPRCQPGRSLLIHRLNVALALRTRLYRYPFYRLVFGEADGLPGLIVDRFDDVLVVQITTAGMEALKAQIVAALEKVLHPRGILLRNDGAAREPEGLARYVETMGEVSEPAPVREGDCSFLAPIGGGQKTGWYYDQSDNRLRLAPYVKDATVLDVYSYVGAWGLQAARAGARHVTCVDSSAGALAVLATNAERNGLAVDVMEEDASAAIQALRAQRQRFDVVILDPPAFVKRKRDFKAGARAYRRINQLALTLLAKNGFLITGSCSYHMPQSELLASIQAAARHVDRHLQLLGCYGQGPDHPVHPAIAETAYLKMFFFRVGRPD